MARHTLNVPQRWSHEALALRERRYIFIMFAILYQGVFQLLFCLWFLPAVLLCFVPCLLRIHGASSRPHKSPCSVLDTRGHITTP